MPTRLLTQTISIDDIITTNNGVPIDLSDASGFSVQCVIDENTDSAQNFNAGKQEIQTLTFPALSAATDGDYFTVTDTNGAKWAAALDKYGLSLSEPSGAIYAAIAAGKKTYVDCSGDGTAEVQTLTWPALAGATDGDYIAFYDARGRAWAIAIDTTGSAVTPPTGAIWAAIPAERKSYSNFSTGTNAASMAVIAETAMNALTDFADYFTTDDTAADGTMLLTSDINGVLTNPVPKSFDDAGAGSISAAETTPGVWATAIEVAASVEAAIDALTGFTALIVTDDTAADGTMTFTHQAYGDVADADLKSFDDAGAGSITFDETTPGVDSDVDVSADTVTIATHGLPTGMKGQLTTTGTLPAGLSLSTDYFVIAVDENTIQLATTLANAQAGTKINITDQGSNGGVHTFTPTSIAGASVTFQKSNNNSDWSNIESATSITADASVWLEVVNPQYKWLRINYTLTAGSMSIDNLILLKG